MYSNYLKYWWEWNRSCIYILKKKRNHKEYYYVWEVGKFKRLTLWKQKFCHSRHVFPTILHFTNIFWKLIKSFTDFPFNQVKIKILITFKIFQYVLVAFLLCFVKTMNFSYTLCFPSLFSFFCRSLFHLLCSI